MSIILVSVCQGVKSFKQELVYSFHFRGYWSGKFVKEVCLLANRQQEFEPGHEYLIYFQPIEYCEQVILGRSLKVKHLEDQQLF